MKHVEKEFLDFDNLELFQAIYGVASLNGFEDISWHNDAMPCMQRIFQYEKKPNITVKIWIDWKNPNYSDFVERRLSGEFQQIAIVIMNERDDTMYEYHFESAIDAILELRNVIRDYE